MAEAIRRHGELERHEGVLARVIEPQNGRVCGERRGRTAGEVRKHVMQRPFVDQLHQEVVNEHPLIVIAQRALRLGEAELALVDEAVVEA